MLIYIVCTTCVYYRTKHLTSSLILSPKYSYSSRKVCEKRPRYASIKYLIYSIEYILFIATAYFVSTSRGWTVNLRIILSHQPPPPPTTHHHHTLGGGPFHKRSVCAKLNYMQIIYRITNAYCMLPIAKSVYWWWVVLFSHTQLFSPPTPYSICSCAVCAGKCVLLYTYMRIIRLNKLKFATQLQFIFYVCGTRLIVRRARR